MIAPRLAALGPLLFLVDTAQAGTQATYRGPVVDMHAHLRLGDTDALHDNAVALLGLAP